MALFNNTPMQPTVADLQELISSRVESIQSGKGIAAKPEKVNASKEDLVLGYFREVFNTTQEKADSVREELAPTMEVLARESALLNAQERKAAGITQSLVEGGGEAYRYEAQDVNNISIDEFNSDFAKDEQESAPITAETDTVEAAVAEAVGTQGPGIMSRQSTNGLPAYIQEGSAFRQALADQEAESYSTIFGNTEKEGKKFAGKDITSMKMSEVFDFVKPGGAFNEYNKDAFGKNTTAIGKYQMVGATLRDLRDRNILDKLGIKEDTTFNRKTQDKIAMHLAERRVKGKSLEAARKGMRDEWEGFKKLDNEELDAIINEIGR